MSSSPSAPGVGGRARGAKRHKFDASAIRAGSTAPLSILRWPSLEHVGIFQDGAARVLVHLQESMCVEFLPETVGLHVQIKDRLRL